MYRGVIQQRADITEYLRDHIVSRKMEQPNGLGRIYRVVHDTTKRDTTSAAAQLTGAQLVERLSHPNGWWRDMAQRLLVERGDIRGASLKRLSTRRTGRRGCTRSGHSMDSTRSSRHVVVTALEDPSREVRASALRIAERWLEKPDIRCTRRC